MTAGFSVNSSGPLHNCSAAEFCAYGLPLRQDPSASRKILLVGKDSYVGSHLKQYLGTENYTLDELNARDLVPDASMFRGWDTVVFLAAIVHQKETAENRELYYDVEQNRTVSTSGYSGIEREFDEQGNKVTTVYIGTDDRPTENKKGVAIIRYEYDDARNCVAEYYFDAQGDPTENSSGAAQIRRTFGEDRSLLSEEKLDLQGNSL